MRPTPERPASSDSQVATALFPTGVTAPKPLTTTRLHWIVLLIERGTGYLRTGPGGCNTFDFPDRGDHFGAAPNMDQLHAYWRMDYIEAPRYPETMKRPFTELPALGDDRQALIVHRSVHAYLVLNRFPYNPGHLLAVPFREVTELEALTPAERSDLMEEIVLAKRLVVAALNAEGVNVGFNLGSVSGGSIAHLHGHIVPRWKGDNNFMPVIGQTRVLPQSLQATYARLAEVLSTNGL